MYVYTSHLLSTPFHVPVRQMLLDLYNGLPGVVLQIGKTKNHDTISFFALVDTCAAINMGNLFLKKYIMKNIHPLSLNLSDTTTQIPSILLSLNVQSQIS